MQAENMISQCHRKVLKLSCGLVLYETNKQENTIGGKSTLFDIVARGQETILIFLATGNFQ